MSIDAARHNFDLMKRTSAYEFAKTRNDYENAGTQAAVDVVVGQMATRLETTPEIARSILDGDGWVSKFEASRPAGEVHAQQSSAAGAAPGFGAAAGAAGQTAQKLGGFRDWKP